MKEGNFVIVIGRQYGAGGRKLGRDLARRLGAEYYDKELLSEAAERLGFRAEIFAMADEKPPSLLQSLLSFNYHSAAGSYSTTAMGSSELYRAQSYVIEQIAAEGPCVIVGRTADYVLREHPRLLSVFLHGDINDRAVRILERGEVKSAREAIELAKKRDHDRSNYYNYFTGRNWGSADNYDLCINTSRIHTDDIADIIASLLK